MRFDNLVKYDCKIKEGAVADAVTYEPVSIPKFPANREKNREFPKIVAFSAPETLNSDSNTGF